MDAPLGYANVGQGLRGWDGNWGTVAVQGPIERPCTNCDRPRRQHHPHDTYCRYFLPAPTPPKPEEVVEAEVTTYWTCHACGKDNEVSGEGAVGGWMECGYCPESSWLEMS